MQVAAEEDPSYYTTAGAAPEAVLGPGPQITLGYDPMGRLQSVQQGATFHINSITYGAEEELTGAVYPGGITQVREYNARLQLTRMANSGGWELLYDYPATANNGQIEKYTQKLGTTTVQAVQYEYDSLKRLKKAYTLAGSSITWGLQYTYDGFGNLNAQTPTAGTPPSWNYSANPANNRILTGFGYDSNGNMTSTPGPLPSTYEYDVANRLKKVTVSGQGVQEYGYGAGNERLWGKNIAVGGGYEIYLYKDGGERLGPYYISGTPGNNIGFYLLGQDPVLPKGLQAERDRLGSRLLSTTTVYLPYGEEYTPGGGSAPANGQDKFATYQRDQMTGLDYAVNRYYSSQSGRFLTADPYWASGGPGDPGNWNRYSYVQGDPVNYGDPAGLARCWVERWTTSSDGALAHVLCQSIGGSQSAEGKWYAVPGIDSKSEQNVLKSAQGEFGHAMDLREARGYLNVAFGKALEALRDPDCKSIFGEGIKDPITGGGLDPEVVLRGLMHGAHGTLDFADDLGEAVVGEARGVGLRFDGLSPFYERVAITFNMQYWNLGLASSNTTALLHELGHAMSTLSAGFGSRNRFEEYDGINAGASARNTALVEDNCTRKMF